MQRLSNMPSIAKTPAINSAKQQQPGNITEQESDDEYESEDDE